MNVRGIEELLTWYVLPCVVMVGISVAYFCGSSDISLMRRLWTSAQGAAGALLYIAALLIASLTDGPRPDLALVLALLYILPTTLLVLSIAFYRGRKEFHVFEVVNVPLIAFTGFIGLFLVGVRAI
jgi:hypothetical protein